LFHVAAVLAMGCPFLLSWQDLTAPVIFPSDGGVVDVRDYGAFGNDSVDDTEAIQAALDAHPNGNRIIFLPPGE